MTAIITPHLNFRGNAREVLSFYQTVFGGDLTVVTYGDARAEADASSPDDVMWGQVEAPNGVRVMAYDVQPRLGYDQGVNSSYLSVRCETADEIRGFWAGLVEGAEIEQDLGPSGWSTLYGKLRDRFGVVWVLDLVAA